MAEPNSKAEKANEGSTILRETRKLDASTDEEVDALRVDFFQEDERADAYDGSGRVVDDLAEEKVAKFTEVGPRSGDLGAESLLPGRDDTSRTLWRHHPNTGIARAGDVVEGNLDEPQEETRMEWKVRTAA
jgi:transcription termination/antitermination protein NusA